MAAGMVSWKIILLTILICINERGWTTDVVLQAVIGRPCYIHLAVTHITAPLAVAVDFGDGEFDQYQYSSTSFSQVLPHSLQIKHVYRQTGQYVISANLSYVDSWNVSLREILAVEPACAIKVELLGPSLVPVLQEVLVSASINANCTPVNFTWDFHDTTGDMWTNVLISNNTYTLVSHNYGVAGTYVIRSIATGKTYSKPLAVELPKLLDVVEPITGISFQPLSGRLVVPLKLQASGSYCTEKLVFEARAERGSHVEFVFDFGDGSQEMVVAEVDHVMAMTSGRGGHAYNREGLYTVCVSSTNPLGSRRQCLARPLLVQMPPEGLRLSKDHYITQPGKAIRFQAVLMTGSNVSFDWQIADKLRVNAGPEIDYTFSTAGNSNVLVTAYNNVTEPGRLTASAAVFVCNAIQDVKIVITGPASKTIDQLIFSTSDSIEFIAHVQPPPCRSEVYLWSWGTQSGQKRRTLINKMTQLFPTHGRYSLLVTVDNYVSNVSSQPVVFHVIQKLVNVHRVQHPKSILLGHKIPFTALYQLGSNLTYTWNFGDGTRVQTSKRQPILHTFTRLGEYLVTVNISNALSSGTLSTIMFVLEEKCDQPLVTLLGARQDFTVFRNEDVRVEADVETNCLSSSNVLYHWNITGPNDSFLHNRRVLVLPTNKMAPGNYTIHLKVQMYGTIVYTVVQCKFRLEEMPLTAEIAGSSIRSVSRQDGVTLIGTTGKNNYNYLESTDDISVAWKCITLTNPKSKCFHNQRLIWNQTELHFVASWLNVQSSKFLFTFHAQRGLENATASQVLLVNAAPKVLHVDLLCENCQNQEYVSKHDPIIISSSCSDCARTTNFEWQIWLVLDENQSIPISQYDCVQPDGSTFYLVANSSDAINNTISNPSFSNSTSHTDEAKSKLNPFASKSAIRRKQSKAKLYKNTQSASSTGVNNSSILDDVGASEGRNPSRIQGTSDKIMAPSYQKEWDRTPVADANATEGFAGEAGSASARNLGTILRQSLSASKDKTVLLTGSVSLGRPLRGVNNRRTSIRRKFEMENFATKQWISMHLLESNTVTGLNRQKLVIKPGVLKPGRTYVVVLDLQDSANIALQGKAKQKIKMHSGPTNGRCTLHPTFGYEYLTSFKLNCLEWVGINHNPLFYELNYNFNASMSTRTLIHHSVDNNFKFVLPAGLREERYTIYLNVAVFQKDGGQTDVCTLSVKVYPITQQNVTAESLINDEIVKPTSYLLLSLKKDDLPDFFSRIHILAHILKSNYSSHFGNYDVERLDGKFVFTGIGRIFLNLISSTKISTEEEALLMLTSIASVMEIYDQRNSDFNSIENVANMTQCASTFFLMHNKCSMFCLHHLEDFIHIYRVLLGNLNSFALHAPHSAAGLVPLFQKYRNGLNMAITAQLRFYGFTQLSLKFSSKYFHVEAVCYPKSSKYWTFLSDWMKLNIYLSKNILADCICVQMITFDVDFPLNQENSIKARKSVVTTNFTTCDGSELNNEKLIPGYPVNVFIKKPTSSDKINSIVTGCMQRHSMDVYSFVISRNVSNQYLFIRVKFQEDFKDPIIVYLSSSGLPCFDSCMLQKRLFPDPAEFTIVIKGHKFFNGENYHFGMVAANYNSFKQTKQHGLLNVNYSLEMEFIECIQWDFNQAHWSSKGCCAYIEETSISKDRINCSCDMVTDYSAQIHPLSLSYQQIDASKLLRVSINPCVPAVLVFIIIVFVALIVISINMSRERMHMCGKIWLKDNLYSDRYPYLITLQTGYRSNAGTSAAISIVLHGENGVSKPRELFADAGKIIFNRGSRNTFLVTYPSNIGAIWKVNIWHDNSGSNPSWFLEDIVVKNMSTENQYYFPCAMWFAVDKADAKIEREFLISETSVTFYQFYFCKFWQMYTKLNFWESLYHIPVCDHFLHFERIICCCLNSTICLALAAMWCKWLEQKYEEHVALKVLPSLEFIHTAAIISFLVFPLQIIPGLLLQFSKLQNCQKTKLCNKHGKQFLVDHPASSGSSNDDDDPDITGIIRESLEDQPNNFAIWETLQTWALQEWNENFEKVDISTVSLQTEKQQSYQSCSPTSNSSGMTSSGFEDDTNCSNDSAQHLYSCFNILQISKHLSFPFWFRYIVWFLCMTCCCGCIAAALSLAICFSTCLCLTWLMLAMLSIAIGICLLLPVLTVLLTFLLTLRRKAKTIYTECICNSNCYNSFSATMSSNWGSDCAMDKDVKRRLLSLRYTHPLKESEPDKYKEKIIYETTISTFVRNLITTIVIGALLIIVAFGTSDKESYAFNKILERQFLRDKSFSILNNETMWWDWLKTSLILTLYPKYEIKKTHSEDEQICNGLLGLILTLYVIKLLLHLQYSYTFCKLRIFLKYAGRKMLIISITIFLLLFIYGFLWSLWEVNKVQGVHIKVVYFVVAFITRNLKISTFCKEHPVMAFVYFGSLFLLAVFTIVVGGKIVVNMIDRLPKPHYLSIEMKDVIIWVKTKFFGLIGAAHDEKGTAGSQDIPVERLLGVLEAQIEDLLSHIDQLGHYEGLLLKDDFGYSSTVNYSLSNNSEQEGNALSFTSECFTDESDSSVMLSDENFTWFDLLADESDMNGESGSEISSGTNKLDSYEDSSAVNHNFPSSAKDVLPTTFCHLKRHSHNNTSEVYEDCNKIYKPLSICSGISYSDSSMHSRFKEKRKSKFKKCCGSTSQSYNSKNFNEIQDQFSKIDYHKSSNMLHYGALETNVRAKVNRIHRTKTKGKTKLRKSNDRTMDSD